MRGFALRSAITLTTAVALVLLTPTPAYGDTTLIERADIADSEASYYGWHEGYNNPTPAFDVTVDGLQFGLGGGPLPDTQRPREHR